MKSLLARWMACAVWACSACSVALPAFAQTAPEAEPVREVRIAADKFERGAAVPAWVDAVPAIPQTQDKSVVATLLADTQFMAGTPQSFYFHRAWQANGQAALDQLGQQSIEFNAEYQRVKLHILRVVRNGQALDRLASANIRYLQRETGFEQGIYSGDVSAAILIDDLRVGDVLEVAYTVEGSNPVVGGKYFESASWDARTPTELRRVTLFQPPGRDIAWRFHGDLLRDFPKPDESMHNGMRRLRWEARGLPRINVEDEVPNDFQVARFLQFSEYKRWSEVTAWATELFRSSTPLPAELKDLAATWQRQPAREDGVAAALMWVQREVRYFSMSLGESSHRPSQPAVTVQRRFGDCKDKSFLLIELLRAMDVKADPVLVSAYAVRGASRLIPSPFAFDHVIVRAEVNGRTYFLDPTRTSQTGKLDAMGQLWEGAEVLVVQPGNDAFTLIATPNQAQLTRDELTEKISVPKFGTDATLQVRHTWSGTNAEYRRSVFAAWPAEQLARVTLESYERRYPGIRHASPPRVEDDTVNNVVTLALNLTGPRITVNAGTDWGVRYGAMNFRGLLSTPASERRTQPLGLTSKRTSRYSLEVEFPPEVAKVTDPSTRSVRDKDFEVAVSSSFRGNRAVVDMELRVLNDRVDAPRTAAYMDAVRRAGEIDPGVFVVRKDEVRTAGLSGKGTPSLQQVLESRMADSIAKITASIDGGKLAGEDLARAYCDRANTLVDSGKAAEGLKDAQQAMRLAPTLGEVWRCRGSAYLALRDYARSITDYSRSITLEPEVTEAYYRRGHARFYSGNLAGAADDFAKAGLEGKGDEEVVLYSELWRVWTQKRLGATPGAAQLKLAAAQPRGEWPRPALAMLHGLVSADDVLKSLEQKKGDEREMALAEAYFYVGQWHYAQGDKVKAAEFFRKTREKGVVIYIEHQSAGIELELLEGAAK